MVMNNILNYLEELKQVTPNADKILTNIISRLREIQNVQSVSQKENFYVVASRVIERDRYRNLRILISQLTYAIQRTEEYDYGPYRELLLDSFNNEQLVKYIIEEISETVNVVIDPIEICGGPADYMNAVEIARTAAGAGKGDWARRSWVWANIVYSVAREGKTLHSRSGADTSEKYQEKYGNIVAERLNELQGKPAFWYFLNYGNKQVTGGGTPYPKNGPTNFIDHSETLIKYSINMAINAEYAKVTQTLRPVSDPETEKYDKVLNELSEAVYNIQSSRPGDVLATLNLADRDVQFIVRDSKTRGKRIGIKTTKYRSYLQ